MNPRKPIKLGPEIEPVVKELFYRFYEKFGRAPAPNDPLFFDPDADRPIPLPPEKLDQLWIQLVESCLDRGEITCETAYAMIKTGRFVTEENKHLLSKEELEEWNEALEECCKSEMVSKVRE